MNDAEADQFALELHGYLKSKGHNVVGDVDWAMFSRPIRGMVTGGSDSLHRDRPPHAGSGGEHRS